MFTLGKLSGMEDLMLVRIDAHKFREARERVDMTQAEVAARVGVTTQHISGIERGVKMPSSELFIRLSRLYQIEGADVTTCSPRVAA